MVLKILEKIKQTLCSHDFIFNPKLPAFQCHKCFKVQGMAGDGE